MLLGFLGLTNEEMHELQIRWEAMDKALELAAEIVEKDMPLGLSAAEIAEKIRNRKHIKGRK